MIQKHKNMMYYIFNNKTGTKNATRFLVRFNKKDFHRALQQFAIPNSAEPPKEDSASPFDMEKAVERNHGMCLSFFGVFVLF